MRHLGVSAVTGENMDELFLSIDECREEYNNVYKPEFQKRVQVNDRLGPSELCPTFGKKTKRLNTRVCLGKASPRLHVVESELCIVHATTERVESDVVL